MSRRKPFVLLLACAMLLQLLAAGALPVRTAQAAGATYYVAVNGSDDWSGTAATPNAGGTDGPFRTIAKAASVAAPGDTVLVREGTYRETITPARSGTADAPIAYRAYPGEEVTISGTEPLTDWQPEGGGIYSHADVDPMAAADNPLGYAEQLFVDGAALLEARWPNTAPDPLRARMATVDEVTANDNASGTRRVTFADAELDTPAGYWDGARIWIVPGVAYGAVTGTVVSSGEGTITFDYPEGAVLGTSPAAGDRYYLFGKSDADFTKNALDFPGEWYYDAANRKVYAIMPGGGDPSLHQVELKRRNYAFNLNDRSYIEISGFRIFGATITTDTSGLRQGYNNIADSQGIVLDGLKVSHPSHFTNLTEFTHVQWAYNTGIILSGRGHILRNSIISDSAGNGVSLAGVGHKVLNNVIHDVNYQAMEGGAISTGFNNTASRDHEIAYNTAYSSGRFIILTRSLENTDPAQPKARIHHNDFSNAMLLTHDGGILYTWADSVDTRDSKGVEIDHNWFHDAYEHTVGAGIYLDERTRGYRVHHNVVWNTKGSMNLGGKNNLVYNNTFYNNGGPGVNNRPNEGTVIRNNIFSSYSTFTDPTNVYSDNLVGTNPLFADPANGNFQLLPGSPAIDKGVRLSPYTDDVPAGEAVDIGAYEYGQPAWTAGSSLPLPTPAAPSGLTGRATAEGNELFWQDNADDERSFILERKDGDWTTLAVLPANTTSFKDRNVGSGSYQYRVRADRSPYSPLLEIGGGRSALVSYNAVGYDAYGGGDNAINPFGPVGGYDHGNWLRYDNLNFPEGLTSARVNVQTWTGVKARIEIWQDALTEAEGGLKIADIPLSAACDFCSYDDHSAPLNPAYRTGVHTIYLLAAPADSSDGDVGNLANFQFHRPSSTLEAPTGLTAAPVPGGGIALAWEDNSGGEYQYKAERSADGVTFVEIAQLPADTTSYTDWGLPTDRTYHYRVRAVNAEAQTAFTPAASAAAGGGEGIAAAPANVLAQAVSETSLRVGWRDTSFTETGYIVERATDAGFTQNKASFAVPADTAEYTLTGLEPGTLYYVRVKGVGSAGESDFSPIAEGRTWTSIPAAPGNLSAKAVSAVRVELNWRDPAGNETGYTVERRKADTAEWTVVGTPAANSTGFVDATGLEPATSYDYRVKANGSAGDSPFTSEVRAATLPVKTGVNTELQPENYDGSSIRTGNVPTVTSSDGILGSFDNYDWVVLRNVDFGAAGPKSVIAKAATDTSGKVLEIRLDERLGQLIAAVPITNTGSFGTYQPSAANLSAPAAGIHDVYLISAGPGAFNLDSIRFLDGQAPPLPAGSVTVRAGSAQTDMVVQWKDNAEDEDGFRIERNGTPNEAEDGWVTAGTVGANATAFTDTGLEPGRAYSYRIVAFNAHGESTPSQSELRAYRAATRIGHDADAEISAAAYQAQSGGVHNWLYGLGSVDDKDWIMFGDVKLDNVKSITANLATSNDTLIWLEVRTGSPTGPLLGEMRIQPTGDYGSYAAQSALLTGASGVKDVYLVFRGSSGIGNVLSVTFGTQPPADSQPPSAPANAAAGPQSGGAVTLTWSPSTDDTGLFGYDVMSGGKRLNKDIVPEASYTVTGLVPGKAYTFTVAARDFAGNVSAPSNTVELTGEEASVNYALNRPVEASGTTCAAHEAAPFGVDGNNGTKWCSPGGGDKWLKVDLGEAVTLNRWAVIHAGSNGEPLDFNTRDFKLQISQDGETGWTDIDAVAGNTSSVTDRQTAPFQARYVRLYITNPGSDGVVRIMEFQVFGPLKTAEPPQPASQVIAGAAPNDDTAITVRWTDRSDHETGFRIERNDSPDESAQGWTVAGTVEADVTSFTDTGLAPGTTHSYRVIAFNDAGDAATSENPELRTYRATTRTAHPADTDLPVKGYQAQNGGVHHWLHGIGALDDGDWIMLSRVDVDGMTAFTADLAAAHAGGVIEVRLDSPDGTKVAELAVAATGGYGTYAKQTAAAIGPVAGVHDVYLVFRNGTGIANLNSVAFTAGSVPAAPGNVRAGAKPGSHTEMLVTWEDLSDNETGFRVERNAAAGEESSGWVTAGSVEAGVTSFTDTGLEEGRTYSYRVIACNDKGDSASSENPSLRTYRATTGTVHPDDEPIDAAAYQEQNGGVHNAITAIGSLDAGDWVKFGEVDLQKVKSAAVALTASAPGAVFELRLGSPDGQRIAELAVPAAGETVVMADLEANGKIKEIADVYLVVREGSGVQTVSSVVFSSKKAR